MSSTQVTIRDLGFTSVYAPTDTAPVVDIILVHGLQGNPRGTWSYDGPALGFDASASSNKKHRRAKELFNFRPSPGHGYNADTIDADAQHVPKLHWPTDLLPRECPQARILVWGYDSHVIKGYSAVNKSNLFGHAKDLLYSLERERPPGRPLIFVAHSLGGLLVKEVLRRSQSAEGPRLQDVIQSTRSVIFLGTPHRGSADYAALGNLFRSMASMLLCINNNGAVLRALGLDSPELELSRESFLQQWRTYQFEVKTFQESTAPAGVNIWIVNDKIVPDTSSSLDDPRERAETLRGDHRSMTKFSGHDDSNYIKVSGEIKRVVDLIATQRYVGTGRTYDDEPYELSDKEKDGLKTLAFPVMMSRERAIREPLDSTCEWLYSTAEFLAWYSGEEAGSCHGLLWLKGKPGAGKSTIMKNTVGYISHRERPASTVAAFFFNARGSNLERSPVGLWRSILHQMCLQDENIRSEFLKFYTDRDRDAGDEDWSWNRIELEQFLRQVFTKLTPQRTFIFIDALDECNEDTVRQVVYFLADLSKSAFEKQHNLKLCLSSRHYPTITIPNCAEIVVEGSNNADIAAYIYQRLLFVEDEKNLKAELQTRLATIASGVFLWVVLVLDVLLEDFDTGKPVSIILQRLSSVPKDMEELYKELCQTLGPEERKLSSRLFRWVLCTEPMDIQDVYLGVNFSTSDSATKIERALVEWGYASDQRPPTKRLVKSLKNLSRGLLEYASDKVQFVHETVREFFLTGPGLGALDPQFSANPMDLTNEMLLTTYINIIDYPPWPSMEAIQKYCVRHALNQARRVEDQGVSLVPFLDRFLSPDSELGERLDKEEEESVLYFMSRHRLASCVEACLQRGWCPDDVGMPITKLKYPTPLMVAISSLWGPGKVEELVASLIRCGADLTRRNMDDNTPLLISLKSGQPRLAALLCDAGADINATNQHQESALHMLVMGMARFHTGKSYPALDSSEDTAKGTNELYQELFDAFVGDQLEARTGRGSTPLHYAAAFGDLVSVQMLLHSGANMEAIDDIGTPLMSAARCSKPTEASICDCLLRHGANVHYQNEQQRTALHYAAGSLTRATVERLLMAGMDPRAVDKFGQNACHYAASNGHSGMGIVRLLVNAGCPKEARDHAGRTPMQVTREHDSC